MSERSAKTLSWFNSDTRRFLGIFVILALIGGIGFVASPSGLDLGQRAKELIFGTRYKTEAILRISTFQPKIIFNIQEQAADYEVFKRTQMQLIKGPVVLDPVLRDPKVASLPIVRAEADPLEWLKSQIQVSFLNGSEILAIGMTGAVPDQLKPIVDSVVSSYMTTVVADEHKNRVRRLEDLLKLYTGYQDDLNRRRASIRELTSDAGSRLGMSSVRRDMISRDLEACGQERRRIRMEKIALEVKRTRRKADPKANAELAVLDEQLAVLSAQENSLAKAEAEALALLEKRPSQSLDVSVEQEQIAILAEITRRLGAEIGGLEVELQAPRRITVLAAAGAPRRIRD